MWGNITVLIASYELDNAFVLRICHNPSGFSWIGIIQQNSHNSDLFQLFILLSADIWKTSSKHTCQTLGIRHGPHKWAAPDVPLLHLPPVCGYRVSHHRQNISSSEKRAWQEEKSVYTAPNIALLALCDYHMCWLHDPKTHMSGNKRSGSLSASGSICRIFSVQN